MLLITRKILFTLFLLPLLCLASVKEKSPKSPPKRQLSATLGSEELVEEVTSQIVPSTSWGKDDRELLVTVYMAAIKQHTPHIKKSRRTNHSAQQAIQRLSTQLINLIDQTLLSSDLPVETSVYFTTIQADCYVLLSELRARYRPGGVLKSAQDTYKKALVASFVELPPGNAVRLEVQLKYAKFLVEQADQPRCAIKVGKDAFRSIRGQELDEDADIVVRELGSNLSRWRKHYR